ncbi:MAG TPA: hypothetical protein VNS09_02175 [Solirubrobacter sp.]|nr:hypothetical protein [Solirubrobacter sp.]
MSATIYGQCSACGLIFPLVEIRIEDDYATHRAECAPNRYSLGGGSR